MEADMNVLSKLVGIPQRISLGFDRKSNRYKNTDLQNDLFDFDSFIKQAVIKISS